MRVTNLATALARTGFQTHLFFVGDPDLPGFEGRENGRLRLNRWCQWQIQHHRGGVYDNEEWKVANYQETIPYHVSEFVVRSAVNADRQVVIIAEEWHTAETLCRLSDSLYFLGLRGNCILMWNANNDMSLHRINRGRASPSPTSPPSTGVIWGSTRWSGSTSASTRISSTRSMISVSLRASPLSSRRPPAPCA